ncbi:unnamed protein product [Ectocarpus sp. 8 AP-2014]
MMKPFRSLLINPISVPTGPADAGELRGLSRRSTQRGLHHHATNIFKSKQKCVLSEEGQNSKRNTVSGWSQLHCSGSLLVKLRKKTLSGKAAIPAAALDAKSIRFIDLNRADHPCICCRHVPGIWGRDIGQHIVRYWHHDRSWYRSQNTQQPIYMCLHGDDTGL